MSHKKKILVSYATAGMGHKKAAIAVEEELRKMPDIEVKNIDVLDYTNTFFKWAYPNGYLLLINRLIYLWGFLYYFFDNRIVHRLTRALRKWYHVMNSAGLVKFILEYKPDVVVSAHFLMPDVMEYVKKKYKLKATVINIVTDYRAHGFWVSEGVDKYVVAIDQTKNDLIDKWGIKPEDIFIAGIPSSKKFSLAHDRAAMRMKYGIGNNDFSVLILSGGYGVGPIFEMVKLLNTLGRGISVSVVCGHNENLFRQIEGFKASAKIGIKNFGYVDIVDELMATADIYIGKAGAISIAEALSMGVPLIFVNPIPGQESRNAHFVEGRGGAKILKDYKDILPIIKELTSDNARIKYMAEMAARTGAKDASEKIAGFAAGV